MLEGEDKSKSFQERLLLSLLKRDTEKSSSVKNDPAMLVSGTDIDLTAKEFSKHEKCYLEYT